MRAPSSASKGECLVLRAVVRAQGPRVCTHFPDRRADRRGKFLLLVVVQAPARLSAQAERRLPSRDGASSQPICALVLAWRA